MLSLTELRILAKERKIKGFSTMKKDELEKVLFAENPKKKKVRFSNSQIKYYHPNK